MPADVDLFLRMVVIGVVVAAPVGAMGILVIQRVLAHGWAAGLATGAGIATADAIYAALAAFGVTIVAEFLVSFQDPLRIVGGFALVWLGWRAIRSGVATRAADAPDSRRLGVLYSSAVGLTLTNPLTIMAFAAVFASAGLVAQAGVASAGIVTVGVALGSLAWWLALTTGVWAVRHAVSQRVMLWINRISGGLLVAFGVLAVIAGVGGLL